MPSDLIHRARNQAPSWRSLAILYSVAALVGLAFGIHFGIGGP
ncbi:hypothetical protein SAMN05444161_7073 [Rhizobiales bacterium GAS191]|nr:hypothetical protein SAMN05444161_7073 [Rhizobiales bacterium GAS191]